MTGRPTLAEVRDRVASGAVLDRPGSFTWPEVGERFNWAHDRFDPMAGANPARAPGVSRQGQVALASVTGAEVPAS